MVIVQIGKPGSAQKLGKKLITAGAGIGACNSLIAGNAACTVADPNMVKWSSNSFTDNAKLVDQHLHQHDHYHHVSAAKTYFLTKHRVSE